jgi:hypothetical protein
VDAVKQEKLDLASELGADHVVNTAMTDPVSGSVPARLVFQF